jgi:hypothetical protein
MIPLKIKECGETNFKISGIFLYRKLSSCHAFPVFSMVSFKDWPTTEVFRPEEQEVRMAFSDQI